MVKIVFTAELVDDLISENCGGYQVRGENNFLQGLGKIPDIQSLNYPNPSPKYPIIEFRASPIDSKKTSGKLMSFPSDQKKFDAYLLASSNSFQNLSHKR